MHGCRCGGDLDGRGMICVVVECAHSLGVDGPCGRINDVGHVLAGRGSNGVGCSLVGSWINCGLIGCRIGCSLIGGRINGIACSLVGSRINGVRSRMVGSRIGGTGWYIVGTWTPCMWSHDVDGGLVGSGSPCLG